MYSRFHIIFACKTKLVKYEHRAAAAASRAVVFVEQCCGFCLICCTEFCLSFVLTHDSIADRDRELEIAAASVMRLLVSQKQHHFVLV